jgi:Flp pilus assembly protein TadD
LGHAIAGWLLDFRVSGISFGYGKQLFKFQLFGTIFSFHRIPTAGLTRSAPKSTGWHRTRYFIKVLAGPAANAIIALTIIFISPYHGGVPNTAQLFLIANLLVVISTLLPYRDPISRWDSDGKNMIKAFSMKPKKIEQAHVLRFLLEAAIRWNHYRDIEGATEWCKKGLALYPDNLQLLDMTGLLCLDRGDYAKARELYTQLLQCDSRPSAWRFKLMNNIAYSDALMGDPSLLPEADAYSEEAYRNLPWADFAIGTRGTVLVEMGKYEDGINLLKESIAKCDDSRSRALNSCHLSVAYARLGDFNQADNYLKLGRQTDSRCSFLERAAAELQKHKENPLPHTTVARD